MIKLWLDDCRAEPDSDWVSVFRAQDAIAILSTGIVTQMSLDHDLGDGAGNGYDVARYCEQNPHIMPFHWKVHSSNPVGRQRMCEALSRAYDAAVDLAIAEAEQKLDELTDPEERKQQALRVGTLMGLWQEVPSQYIPKRT